MALTLAVDSASDDVGPADHGDRQSIAPMGGPVLAPSDPTRLVDGDWAYASDGGGQTRHGNGATIAGAEQSLVFAARNMWTVDGSQAPEYAGDSQDVAHDQGGGAATYLRDTGSLLSIANQDLQGDIGNPLADDGGTGSNGLPVTYSYQVQSYFHESAFALGLGLAGPFDVHAANADGARPVGQESDNSFGAAFDDVVLSGRFSAASTTAGNGIGSLSLAPSPLPQAYSATVAADWAGPHTGIGAPAGADAPLADIAVAYDPVSAPSTHRTISQAGVQITRDNYHWGTTLGAGTTISFGFATSAAGYSVTGHNISGFSAFTASEQAAARAALGFWSSISGISFTDQGNSNNATILFRNYNDSGDGSQAFAFSPTSNDQSSGGYQGDVFMNLAFANANAVNPGTYDWETMIHEIGHALGLEHPGSYNAAPGVTITYNGYAEYIEDTRQYTLMSYFSQTNTGGSFSVDNETPGLDDIAAIQRLYGANNSTRTGNNTYGFNSNVGGVYAITSSSQHVVFSVWDAGGSDTFNFSGYSATQTIDLRVNLPTDIGHFSSVGGNTYNVAIGAGVVIENAYGGSGSDTFYGNSANNTLSGNNGFDTVVFNGNRLFFAFTEGDSHNYTVSGNSQGTDALNSIERFIFNDVTVTDDHVGGTSTASVIGLAPAGSVTGDRQFYGDHDWFRATLLAGHNYVIDERGSPSGGGTLADAYVYLHNSAGTQVAFNDDGGIGFDSQLAVHVATPGTYYLDASAFSNALGTYTLELEDLGMVNTRFQGSHVELNSFGPHAGGWMSQDATPRMLGQANTDFGDSSGLSDIFGFGSGGVYVALAHNGGFSNPGFVLPSFGSSAAGGGWTSQDLYPREVARIDNTFHDDIVGFGSGGVYVALGNGENSWALPTLTLHSFGASAGGWTSQDHLPRLLADVNADGQADIVGFGSGGVYVALNTGAGTFANPFLSIHSFGSSAAAGGWSSQNVAPRALADVNDDGYNDIVGFGTNATYVALGTGNGHFGPAFVALQSFGSSPAGGGWTDNNTYPRELADINYDGRADIVGFGGGYVYYALGQSDGTFSLPVRDIHSFGPQSGGWSSQDLYPRLLGDVTGDQHPDIIAFGDSGVYVSRDFDFVTV